MKTANIISLPRSYDRREKVVNSCSRHGWPYYILDGVDGLDDQAIEAFDYDRELFRRRWGREIRKGEVGCYAAHLQAMEHVVSTEEDFGIIMEDDTVVLGDQEPLLEICEYFDVCYISAPLMHGTHSISCESGSGPGFPFVLTKAPIGTQGYAVSRKFAIWFLDNHGVISAPIDEELRELCVKGAARFVMVTRPLLTPDWSAHTVLSKTAVTTNSNVHS